MPFAKLTHQAYAERLCNCWERIEAIFTDEPALMSGYMGELDEGSTEVHESIQNFLDSSDDVMKISQYPPAIHWEARLPEWFEKAKGYPIWRVLPSLFLDLPDARGLRYDFYDIISARVAESYFGVIKKHCEHLGIKSTGHLLAEDKISQHVQYSGHILRCLRQFHIPGNDILTGKPETMMQSAMFMAPKTASSVSHINDAPATMIETFDYCERTGLLDPWPLTMEERLSCLATICALGVDTIVSYYPFHPAADITGTAIDARLPELPGRREAEPLGPEYRIWADCAARLSMLLRGGCHVCNIAVYYPIEGVRAHFKPSGGRQSSSRDTNPVIRTIEDTWICSCRILLQNQHDFDFVDVEALEEARFENGSIKIARERYRVLILTYTSVISLRALRRMNNFLEAGGALVLVGAAPSGPVELGAEEEFSRLWKAISEKNVLRATVPADLPSVLATLIDADVHIQPETPGVVCLHKRHDDRDTYLLVNTTSFSLKFTVDLGVNGNARLFRLASGEMQDLSYQKGSLKVSLDVYESAAIVIGK